MKGKIIVLVLIGVLAVAACGGKATETPKPNMPNPASVFCEEKGYKLEIRTAADGSQQGFCIFPDGSECDEWAFFRGECGPKQDAGGAQMANPASVFCEEKGYKLEIRTAADGSQQGFCVFPDGSECDEWAFFRGECGPGTPKP
jgi:putative hemolysin